MRFLAKLLKHWYLYLIPFLLLPAAGTLYGKQKLSIYETSALLYIYSSDAVAGTNTGFNQYVSPAQNGSDLINDYMQSNSFVVTIAKSTDLGQQYDLTSRADQDIVVQRIRALLAAGRTALASWSRRECRHFSHGSPCASPKFFPRRVRRLGPLAGCRG